MASACYRVALAATKRIPTASTIHGTTRSSSRGAVRTMATLRGTQVGRTVVPARRVLSSSTQRTFATSHLATRTAAGSRAIAAVKEVEAFFASEPAPAVRRAAMCVLVLVARCGSPAISPPTTHL